MMKATKTLLLLTFALTCCTSKRNLEISIISDKSNSDTLYLREVITNKAIAKIRLKEQTNISIPIDETALCELSLNNSEETYLTIIRPGVEKRITIDSINLFTQQSIPDSLVNYLWISTNAMLSLHGKILFGSAQPEKVVALFDSLINARYELINRYGEQLTMEERGILHYQNQARAYSFLMYYGRMIKNYTPQDSFFNFIEKIDSENPYTKTLPNNLLYKYEIQYLQQNDSIESISSFLQFIEHETPSKDLQDFLKSIYLKDVVESPSYWRKHQQLFTTPAINEALTKESKNHYSYLIQSATRSFLSSQKGQLAFDFVAKKPDGTSIKLSDLKGKVVLLDIWATWCGPCLTQRPTIQSLASQYKNNPEVIVVMVSIDKSSEKWKQFVSRENQASNGLDVHIPDGLDTEFGEKYSAKAIPKYVLIDQNGRIIDSSISEPSIEMSQLINGLLKN